MGFGTFFDTFWDQASALGAPRRLRGVDLRSSRGVGLGTFFGAFFGTFWDQASDPLLGASSEFALLLRGVTGGPPRSRQSTSFMCLPPPPDPLPRDC